jgi:hypothetical protein
MREQNVIVSALPSLASCPKFVGQEEAGPAATFGSAFHKAMETGDIAHALTPEALKAAKDGQGFNQAAIEEAFAWAQEWKQALLDKMKPAAEVSELEGALEMIPGRRFFIDWFLSTDAEGTKLVVVDWKTGRGIYNAEDNLQGKAYALAMFQLDPVVDQVMVVFVTPFVKGQSAAVFTRDTSDKLAMDVYRVVTSAFSPDSEPCPGDACKFCGKFGTCSAVKSLTDTEVLTGWLEEARTDPEKMSALLGLCPVLTKLIDEIKAAASRMRFDAGIEIPGYTVVHSSSKTKVQEVQQVVKYLTSNLGLDAPTILSYCSLSVNDLEDLIMSTAKRGTKDDTLDRVMTELRAQGCVTGGQGDGTPYLKKLK